jgi:glycosyltransferase involved in cell wall biosynthesis
VKKIAFLCSSLEAGRDGVGDYVRQFAQNLTREGHRCQLIALADKFVRSPSVSTDTQHNFEVVRIPADHWNSADTRVAEDALSAFAPDWLSLQMVCYGYESRGLLLRSARSFERLRRFARGHMMFHELWIGESAEYGIKERCVGWLQKKLLLRATRMWSPDVIHTSNPLYGELLRRNGIQAAELPLPGNIEVSATDSSAARRWLLERAGLRSDESAVLAGVFGSIHPEWRDSAWLSSLHEHCRGTNRRPVVIQIGRAGSRGEAIWKELQLKFQDRVEFRAVGEIPAAEVSRALLALDLGIATSPWPLIGKSGAVAAMLEHGVPVIVTRDDFRLRRGTAPEPTPHPLLHRFDGGFTDRSWRQALGKRPPRPRSDIYRLFLESLQERS